MRALSDIPAAIEGFWLNPCLQQAAKQVGVLAGRFGLIKTEKKVNHIDFGRCVSFKDMIAPFY